MKFKDFMHKVANPKTVADYIALCEKGVSARIDISAEMASHLINALQMNKNFYQIFKHEWDGYFESKKEDYHVIVREQYATKTNTWVVQIVRDDREF